MLFLVLRLATRRAGWLERRGAVTGLFLICYGTFRIALENVRMPDAGLQNLPLGLTVGMMLSAPMILGGALAPVAGRWPSRSRMRQSRKSSLLPSDVGEVAQRGLGGGEWGARPHVPSLALRAIHLPP